MTSIINRGASTFAEIGKKNKTMADTSIGTIEIENAVKKAVMEMAMTLYVILKQREAILSLIRDVYLRASFKKHLQSETR